MSYNLGSSVFTQKIVANNIGDVNNPVDTAYITNIVPPPTSATPNLQQVCDVGSTTTTDVELTTGTLKTTKINEPGDEVHIRGRVGIGTDPTVALTEDLEVDGNIQIDTTGLGKIVFYDKAADHEHAEYDADGDGTNGGQLLFKTKEDGGSVQTHMVIRENGRVGINTTTPQSNLQVEGTITATGLFTTSTKRVEIQEYDLNSGGAVALSKPFVEVVNSGSIPPPTSVCELNLPDASASNWGQYFDVSTKTTQVPSGSFITVRLNYNATAFGGGTTPLTVDYEQESFDAPGSYTRPTLGRYQVSKDYGTSRYVWKQVMASIPYE